MSNTERGFVPISEAQSDRVRVVVGLPSFVNQAEIGVNLKRVETLCQIGGIGHLRVVNESGETSSSVPQVVGFDGQGNAYAGKAALKSASLSHGESRDEQVGLPEMRWKNTTLALNLDEIAARIEKDVKWDNGIRSSDAWSHYIDKGVRGALSSEATRSLISMNGRDKYRVAIAIAFASLGGDRLPFTHIEINPILAEIASYVYLSGIWNSLNRFRFGPSPKLSDRSARYSLFYGPQLDRAAVVNLMARAQKVVKKI